MVRANTLVFTPASLWIILRGAQSSLSSVHVAPASGAREMSDCLPPLAGGQ